MSKYFSFLFLGMLYLVIQSKSGLAQQAIGTSSPHSSSILDVSSTSKGVLVPRLTQSQMTNLSNPVAGLQIYNTTNKCMYTYSGTAWICEKKIR